MRTILLLALAIAGTGCSTPSKNKIQPGPVPRHDNKTPVALGKPVIIQRLEAQRALDAQVAQGDIAVEGQRR